MDQRKAERFAAALTDLCREHRVMIWTAYETTPIIATEAAIDDEFRYEVEPPDPPGRSVFIRRRLLPA